MLPQVMFNFSHGLGRSFASQTLGMAM